MIKDQLRLRNINELIEAKDQFYIPAYQRGYRWSSRQVEDLLNDILEFHQKEKKQSEFYCLQPIVVRKNENKWEIIDGQQRLTTLFIIFSFYNSFRLESRRKKLFSIEYITRPNSQEYLLNINENDKSKNIDFYHIYGAFKTVEAWFEHRENLMNDIESILLNRVKIIWYEITDGSDPIDVFTRLNIGKIPLTNAELIKALFLQSSNFQQDKASLKQIQIATEWDLIEKSLQDSAFWSFIYNPVTGVKYATRIEFIFDLMKKKTLGAEAFFTFNQFNTEFKANTEVDRQLMVDRLWKEVKAYFLTFDEWYRDRELYHLIGFLIACGQSVNAIKAKGEEKNSTKTGFKDYLISKICEQLKGCNLDTLVYDDRKKVRKVLLLANIQTLLSTKEADIRFPFDRYKEESWDIEHIRSQTEKEIVGKSRIDWLKDVLEYFTGVDDPIKISLDEYSEDKRKIISGLCQILKAEKIDDEKFKKIYNIVASEFKEGVAEWTQGMGNLALLDLTTNRSYQNAMFPIKRKRIIHNDERGLFVPICTKNAFLKYYSTNLGDVMYWQEADARDYLAAMKQVLKKYLPSQESAI